MINIYFREIICAQTSFPDLLLPLAVISSSTSVIKQLRKLDPHKDKKAHLTATSLYNVYDIQTLDFMYQFSSYLGRPLEGCDLGFKNEFLNFCQV